MIAFNNREEGLTEVYLGDNKISEVYIGDNKVYPINGGDEGRDYKFKFIYNQNSTNEIYQKPCEESSTTIVKGELLTYAGKPYYDGPYTYEQYITDVIVGDCVTTTVSEVFEKFINMRTLTYGSGITKIEDNQFWSSQDIQLQSITIYAKIPPTIYNYSFTYKYNTNFAGPIYVPSESVEAYKTAWSNFASQIQPIP